MMIRLRACLFLWGFFFSVLAFTQTTIWDGASWDNGEPIPTKDAQISGNLLLSQMSSNEVVCRSLTIDAGVTITYDLANGLTILSLLFINFRIILLADFGPSPGNFENC